MITIFVQNDRGEHFIVRDDGAQQDIIGGPWRTAQVALRQAENAARKAAKKEGKQAIWTVKPDDVASREQARTGEFGSRSAWIVR